MSVPRVSVVIPVYNGTNYLRDSINSVLAQTYPNYEIIVVDDGSTDGTWELIQSYGNRVRGIRKENGGTSSALNRGIQESRGEFIAWLSHDDVFLPHKLEKQIALLNASPHLAGCYSDYFIIDANGAVTREMKMPHYPRDEMVRHLLQYMFVNGCTVLVRRACFDVEGWFDHRLLWAHDADMWFRILRHFEFGYVPEALTQYRVHARQESQKRFKMRADAHEFWRRCVEEYPLVDIFPELQGRDNIAIARARNCLGDIMRVAHGDMPLARAEYIRSLKTWRTMRNPAFWRAVTLQFWLPNPLWLVSKTFQLLRRKTLLSSSSTQVQVSDEIVRACNVVPCPKI